MVSSSSKLQKPCQRSKARDKYKHGGKAERRPERNHLLESFLYIHTGPRKHERDHQQSGERNRDQHFPPSEHKPDRHGEFYISHPDSSARNHGSPEENRKAKQHSQSILSQIEPDFRLYSVQIRSKHPHCLCSDHSQNKPVGDQPILDIENSDGKKKRKHKENISHLDSKSKKVRHRCHQENGDSHIHPGQSCRNCLNGFPALVCPGNRFSASVPYKEILQQFGQKTGCETGNDAQSNYENNALNLHHRDPSSL